MKTSQLEIKRLSLRGIMCKIRRTFRIYKSDADILDRLFKNPSKAVRLLISSYVQRNVLPTARQIDELQTLQKEVHRIGVNLNQIARKINSGETTDLTEQIREVRQVLKQIKSCLRGFDAY